MSNEIRILYPDVLSVDEHAVERAIVPDGVIFDIYGGKDPADVPDEVWQRCDGMVTGIGMPIDESVIGRLGKCRIITRLGVGYDLIDAAAAGRKGIPVCNVPDYGTTEVADHAMAMLLSFTRGTAHYNEVLRDNPAEGWSYLTAPTTVRMAGKTLGVIGLGRIGTAAALRGKAFGMEVIAYDPLVADGHELAVGVRRVDSLADLLGEADFVTIHAPSTPETTNMIDASAVAAMKPGLILVNTARGQICDVDAIYDGLKSGQLGAVGLDVFPDEPVPEDYKLIKAWRAREPWLEGRFLASPHAAFYSAVGLQFLREKAVMTCVNYIRGGVLKNCVNQDSLATTGD